MTKLVTCKACNRQVPQSINITEKQPISHVAYGRLGYQLCSGSPIPMSYVNVAIAQHEAFLVMDLE